MQGSHMVRRGVHVLFDAMYSHVSSYRKDQGCQYMRCQQCSHGFCWICLGAFDHKAHNCNKFTGVEKGTERNEWNRYTHFYERWKGHADSLMFEAKLMAKAGAYAQALCAPCYVCACVCAYESNSRYRRGDHEAIDASGDELDRCAVCQSCGRHAA